MRSIILPIILIIFFHLPGSGQTRPVTGKIVNNDFEPIPVVSIYTHDTAISSISDYEGVFKIELPFSETKLLIASVGYERSFIEVPKECNHLEIILLSYSSYDFMSARKVDRLRKKEFDKLPTIHNDANKKGIFKSSSPCYTQSFTEIRKTLQAYKKEKKKLRKSKLSN